MMSLRTASRQFEVPSYSELLANGSYSNTEINADGASQTRIQDFMSFIKSLDFSVLPSNDTWTCDKQKPVRLRCPADNSKSSSSSSSAAEAEAAAATAATPISVMSAFVNTVERFGTNTALATKVDGKWDRWTFEEYFDDVIRAAKSLIAIGVQPFDGVGIIGFNSPEWFIADIAAIFAGGLATGIYTTNNPEACKYVALNADCSVIVVENDLQLQKFLSVRSELPRLKAIVQYKGNVKARYDNVYTWEAFMKLGETVADDELKSRIEGQHCNQCCTLIYTSGTVGSPKGVMISHDNVTWTAAQGARFVGLTDGAEVIISYLPLSHIAAQVVDIFLPITRGYSVYFAQPDAMKGSLGDYLKDVRPTLFLGVPRVWEKFAEKMSETFKKSGRVKRSLLQWSRQIGLKGNLSKMNGGSPPMGWSLAQQLVFRKIRLALGLDRCRFCATAAAPIMSDTLEFFASINIPLMEFFGMSETTGPQTYSNLSKWRIRSVGPSSDVSPVFISNPDSYGEGEMCLEGRNIFMGYLNEVEKTNETFDENGRLKSGDLGRVDPDGFIYVTGRIKELIITAGGENVAPIPIEDAVKESLSICLSNCMLIGDQRNFLSMLITLKVTVVAHRFSLLDSCLDLFKIIIATLLMILVVLIISVM